MDKHIKRILEMSSYDPKKGKQLIKESLHEQPNVGTNNAPVNQPQQNQAQSDASFEKEIDTALSQIVKELPQQIQQFAKTQGDKDGQVEPIGQQNQQPAAAQTNSQQPMAEQELNEAIGALVAGTGFAIPAITNLVGKSLTYLGNKTDNQTLQSVGQKIHHVAEHLHHKYLDVIKGILSPYIGTLPPKTQDSVVNGIFYAIVAALGAAGVAGASHAVHGGNIGLASVEGGLSGVKASELIAAARSIIPKILGQVVA